MLLGRRHPWGPIAVVTSQVVCDSGAPRREDGRLEGEDDDVAAL